MSCQAFSWLDDPLFLIFKLAGSAGKLEGYTGATEHLEGVDPCDVVSLTGIGDIDPLARARTRSLVSHDGARVRGSESDEEVVGSVSGELVKRCLGEVPRLRPGGQSSEK